jgi:sugar lactone lactonase YvrE
LAVDGAGDLFIADFDNNRVVEVPAGGGAATAIDPVVNGEGLLMPQGLAVDEAGDLFIGDTWQRAAWWKCRPAAARQLPSTRR